jgi:hypothetical protein
VTNQYRVLVPAVVALYEDGVFERDLSPVEEQDLLDRGWLEIVPRPYRVLSDNYTVDGSPVPQGAVVELALPVEVEAALIAGGHLERCRRDAQPTVDVDPEPEPGPKSKSKSHKSGVAGKESE